MTFKYFMYIVILVTFSLENSFAAITCSEPKTECVEGKDLVKHIENIPFDPGCWRRRVIQECKEQSDNNCQQLIDQKCSQIEAKCKIMLNGTCVVQDATYRCPVNKCEEIKTSCGKDIFCMNGECAPTNPVKSTEKDLGKALSYLSALDEAAKQVKDQNSENFVIFAGKVMECSRAILPGITKDCCANNEWLGKCAEDEKELFQMRQAGRAIKVGRYCYSKDPITKSCTSRHTAYCVFGSKIARIIQNDGRKNQLGIGFGYVNDGDKVNHVDCRGITGDELAKMKFDLMDFSELYDAISEEAKKRAPKNERLEQKATSYTPEELKEKSIKNIKGLSESPETSVGLKAAERIKEFYGDRVKK